MGAGASKSKSRRHISASHRRKLAKMEKLRENYEVEGFKRRVITLYHITSPDSAKSIVNSKKMLRGTVGMFGGGIYFAETIAIANCKAHHSGAIVTADVNLGFSLICRQAEPNLNYGILHFTYGCNSVKGAITYTEYVVYNWGQVVIKNITIEGKDYYKNSDATKKQHYCKNSLCLYYKEKHLGNCRIKCTNSICQYNGEYHLGSCSI